VAAVSGAQPHRLMKDVVSVGLVPEGNGARFFIVYSDPNVHKEYRYDYEASSAAEASTLALSRPPPPSRVLRHPVRVADVQPYPLQRKSSPRSSTSRSFSPIGDCRRRPV
jgi:hypothetical protein